MSDLDADLYGGKLCFYRLFCRENLMSKCLSLDLYETDFADAPQDDKSAIQTPAEPKQESQAASIPKPAETTTTKAPTSIDTSTVQSYSAPSSAQTPIAPAISPPTQQIPTYEEPQASDYRELPPPRNDGGYQNISVAERSVRPSEMKDEG